MNLLDVLKLFNKKHLSQLESISYHYSSDDFILEFCVSDDEMEDEYKYFVFSVYLYSGDIGNNKYDFSRMTVKQNSSNTSQEYEIPNEAISLYEEISEIWYEKVIKKG